MENGIQTYNGSLNLLLREKIHEDGRTLLAKGPRFKIRRSVRQRCPLAPFLFLLYAEETSIFLSSGQFVLKDISMLLSREDFQHY